MELNTTSDGSSFSQGMYADPPSVKRPSPNKSGKGTHLTTIRDQGECALTFHCAVEYTVKHTLPLNHIEVELGEVVEVSSVYVTPVYYGERSVVLEHRPLCIVGRSMSQWVDSANVILTEHTAIEERIVQEIVDKLAA